MDADKDPASRHRSLRDFIAESRRNRRSRQSQNLDDEDDISVVVAAPGPGRVGGSSAAAPPEEGPDLRFSEDGEEEADAVGTRRNIGREFDEEGRAWEGGERGPGNGQDRGREGGGAQARRHAPKGEIPDLANGDSVDDENDERGGDVHRSSRPSSTSSSSSPQREQLQQNAVGDEAVGAMEGVHPGLATYDSQRSAAAMDGGGHAGQEEYARMLELMQKVRR